MDVTTKQLTKTRFPARPYQLKQIRYIVQNALLNTGFSNEDVDGVVLAVNEACMNIIQHAYKNSASGEIILEIFNTGDEVLIRLTDFAEPVDEHKIKGRDLADVRPGGLGVHFMEKVMDSIHFCHRPDGRGNILEMRKKITG
jgi:sigma-B regulation protein RsbU (phosphoserine phosphatase)